MADYDEGLQVVDVNDLQNPVIIGSISTQSDAKGVALSGDTAFVTCSGYLEQGLQVVDVSDPRNPLIIGSVDTPGYAVDVVLSGNLAFVADAGLQVVNVNDPSSSPP